MIRHLKSLLLIIIVISFGICIYYSFYMQPAEKQESIEYLSVGVAENVKLIIVYDNNPYDSRLKTAWGFSCIVNISNTLILFDTGGDPDILLYNMEMLNISVQSIQIIVLSHIHGDHVGGLFGVLSLNSNVTVYVLSSFPSDFKNEIKSYGCEVIEVSNATKVYNGVATTGELGNAIKEQSLIINSTKGLIIVTGCAHPGIVNIAEKAKQLIGNDIYLVIGGFHLAGKSEDEISSIIQQLKDLGVQKVAPCHCSGDLARDMFRQEFGDDYIEVGVGSIIEIDC